MEEQGQGQLDAAKAEHARIVSDTTHPLHGAYLRGDTSMIENLYKAVPGGDAQVNISSGVEIVGQDTLGGIQVQKGEGDSSGDDPFAELREEWGPDFDTNADFARAAGRQIFADDAEFDAVASAVEQRIGPARAARLLHKIATLIQKAGQ